jgi:WD40 repeat protein
VLTTPPPGRVTDVAFAFTQPLVAAAKDDGYVHVWDLTKKERRPTFSLKDPKGDVLAVAFAPNSSLLASGGEGRTINLWDCARSAPAPLELPGHSGRILALVFSANGQFLASAAEDKTIRLWDMRASPPRSILEVADQLDEAANRNVGWRGRLLAFSPDGKRLAVARADGTIRLLALSLDGRPRAVQQQALRGHHGPVSGLAFAPNGALVSCAHDGTVRDWHLAGSGPARQPLLDAQLIAAAAFDPEGRKLAAVCADGMAVLWHFEHDDFAVQYFKAMPKERPVAMALSKQIFAATSFGEQIYCWDVSGKKAFPGETLRGHTSTVNALSFSDDGGLLASGGRDKRLKLWDMRAQPPAPGREHEQTMEVSAVVLSADGRRLASAGNDLMVRHWRVSGTSMQALGQNPGRAPFAFSSDGQHFASIAADTSVIQLWRCGAAAPLAAGTLSGLDRPPLAIAFARDGRTLAAVNEAGQLSVWQCPGGAVLKKWDLPGAVYALAFSADGRYLFTANVNNTVYVLQVAND